MLLHFLARSGGSLKYFIHMHMLLWNWFIWLYLKLYGLINNYFSIYRIIVIVTALHGNNQVPLLYLVRLYNLGDHGLWCGVKLGVLLKGGRTLPIKRTAKAARDWKQRWCSQQYYHEDLWREETLNTPTRQPELRRDCWCTRTSDTEGRQKKFQS